jgi:hypothetical protein
VLVSLRHSTSVIDVKSSRGPNCVTDHYLVKTKVKERIVRLQKMDGVNPKKWDVRKLQESKEIKQEYQRKIEESIGENREEGNEEENWKRIEKVIKEVADKTEGKEGN